MHVRYSTVTTEVGPLVAEFVGRGLLVLFAEGAPEELHEFSVLHRPDASFDEVRPGDKVAIGEHHFEVTAVGDVANRNLESLGHAVFKANGFTEAELPGDICLGQSPLPVVKKGTTITIEEPS